MIAADLRAHCDRTEIQEFDCQPWAFIWQTLLTTPLSLVASTLLFFGHFAPAALLYLALAIASVLEFGFYRELLDRLFPKRRCANVVGVLEPRGKVARQVVLSAHHDSAYEFRYMRWSRFVYVGVVAWSSVVCYGFPLLAGGLALADVVWGAQLPAMAVRGLGLFGILGGLAFLGFVRFRAVPGAGDNLASSGLLVHLAAELRAALSRDPDALGDTRVVFASFDAEESGLRGARAFVRDNRRGLLAEAPTVNLNLESFYELDELAVLVTDLNGTVRLSKELAALIGEEAAAEGLRLQNMRMLYGFGATDAAEFARAGFCATTLLAVPHDLRSSKRVIYHTREDVPENLDPAALEAAARLTLRVIQRITREAPAQLFAQRAA